MRRSALPLAVAATLWASAAAWALEVHHEAVVRLWPAEGRLEGEDEVRLAGSGPVRVRLAPGLELRGAAVEGRPVPIRPDGDGVWRPEVQAAAGQVIRLVYGGRLGGDPPTDTPPFLAAEGGFLPGGSGWLPEVDDGSDVTFDLTLETPLPFRAVADGGRLLGEAEERGVYRARFASERGGDAPSAFVGPYVVAERRDGDLAVRTYFYPEEGGLADLYLGRTLDHLRRLEARIGEYPYAGFAVVAGPLPVGYGFPGLTYVSRRILHLPFMQAGSLAHEVAHSWWGNAVRVAYEGGNWAEGLTTYVADYALAEDAGSAKAAEMRLAWLRDFNALPPGRDAPLRAFVGREHDAGQVVGYGKTALVFHMLRRQAGEAGFAEGLRRFYRDHRFRRASWDDLRRSFEAAAGQDLGPFFAQWLERTGAPRLDLAEVRRQGTAAGGHEVVLTLRQEEPAYSLLVPVVIETEAGPERADVRLVGAETTVVLPARASPRSVSVDPEHDVFRRLAPGEAPPILRDVTLSGDAATLIATGEGDPAGEIANGLAASLLDAPGRPARPGEPAPGARPLLVIGIAPAVTEALASAGLPRTPPSLAGRGTARVWTGRRADGAPLLVVEADDARALQALARPLPHYRRESYLVFEGGQAVDRGTWPTGESALRRRLD